jgi:hypothetical protein
MKAVAVIFLLLPMLVAGQGVMPLSTSGTKLSHYLAAYSRTSENSAAISYDAVEKSIARFQGRRASFKNEKAFLEHVFVKTHQRFLKTYKEYATFNELFKGGTYNCLTGTALYALLLEELGFSYTIIETNYHIFLLAAAKEGRILFEATDPLNGFVADEHEIVKRIEGYKQNTVVQARNDKTYYQFDVQLYNTLDLDDISGLLHYNLAVEALNSHSLEASITHLGKAMEIYRSQRIEEFSKILLLSVIESNLEMPVKERCVRRIRMMQKNNMLAVVSALAFE